MIESTMNKLARPDCSNCGGTGKVDVPVTLGRGLFGLPRAGAPHGFRRIACEACDGTGKR